MNRYSLTGPKPQINFTRDLKHQNAYTQALLGEFSDFAFDEVRAPQNRGQWRQTITTNIEKYSPATLNKIKIDVNEIPLDLEIGTGTGLHFAHYSKMNTERMLVGIELKYKPLIQTIRRARSHSSANMAIARYHAFNMDELFAEGEIDNILIHFPDPWTTPRKPKNRIAGAYMLEKMFFLQRQGSILEFKTDSLEYFLWALEEVNRSPYHLDFQTTDLHQSIYAANNFETAFEKLFLRKGMNINYMRLIRL